MAEGMSPTNDEAIHRRLLRRQSLLAKTGYGDNSR